MCFDTDSRPPIEPIAGGALDHEDLVLTAADGNRFAAFRARPATPLGPVAPGIVILPDVRGLHPYYEELVLRFAEAGVDALAFDYFGRTAGPARRDTGFDTMPHVGQTTWAGLSADVVAAADGLRADGRVGSVFTVGFCFGGRLAFLTATLPLGLAGAIGFYGLPTGPRGDIPAPVDVAGSMRSAILGLFGGDDRAIPPEAIESFEAALSAAHVSHELVAYPGAPHSFFDRKAADFAVESGDAWRRILDFIREHAAAG